MDCEVRSGDGHRGSVPLGQHHHRHVGGARTAVGVCDLECEDIVPHSAHLRHSQLGP